MPIWRHDIYSPRDIFTLPPAATSISTCNLWISLDAGVIDWRDIGCVRLVGDRRTLYLYRISYDDDDPPYYYLVDGEDGKPKVDNASGSFFCTIPGLVSTAPFLSYHV